MTELRKVDWRRPQPAPRYLAQRLRANFPQITQTGIYNDRNIAGTQQKSAHAEGRALDIHLKAIDPVQRSLGDQLCRALIRKARAVGIDNVIWNRQIWSLAKGGPRPYTGDSPHTDHMHVEFTRAGSQHVVLREIELEIAIIRTGIEDLHSRQETIA